MLALSMPGAPEWIVIFMMGLALLGLPALVAIVVVSLVLRNARRSPRETRCRRCGQVLFGLTEPKCPQCGEPI